MVASFCNLTDTMSDIYPMFKIKTKWCSGPNLVDKNPHELSNKHHIFFVCFFLAIAPQGNYFGILYLDSHIILTEYGSKPCRCYCIYFGLTSLTCQLRGQYQTKVTLSENSENRIEKTQSCVATKNYFFRQKFLRSQKFLPFFFEYQ